MGSIQACVDGIGDGDTCFVREGTFVLTQQIGIWGKDGSPGRPRRLAAYRGERVIIDGQNVVAANSNAAIVLGSGHWIIEGLEVINARTAGIQGWGAHHAQIRNNRVRDCKGAGIALWWRGPRTEHAGVLVEKNTVHDCALDNVNHTATSWPGGIAVQFADDAIIRDNSVQRVHGEGVLSYLSNRVTFQRNIVHDTYGTCYYFDNTTNSVMEQNFCHQTHDPRFFPESPPNRIRPHNGIQIANEEYDAANPSAGNLIRNNVVVGARHGFYYGNYQLGGGLIRTLVANNVFYLSDAASVHIDPDSHEMARLANNVFVMKAGTPATDTEAGLAGVTFDHNLWHGTPEMVVQGPGDVLGDPKLSNPGVDDPFGYRPHARSIARGAGIDLSAEVPRDFAGSARAAPWDIGPFELKSSGNGGNAGGGDNAGGAGNADGGDNAGGSAGGGGDAGGSAGGGGSGLPGTVIHDQDDATGGCGCRILRGHQTQGALSFGIFALGALLRVTSQRVRRRAAQKALRP